MANELNIYHQTVLNHLQRAGYKKKLDIWVPHELSMRNKMGRLNICHMLLQRNQIGSFLKRIITGNEKMGNLGEQRSKEIMQKKK